MSRADGSHATSTNQGSRSAHLARYLAWRNAELTPAGVDLLRTFVQDAERFVNAVRQNILIVGAQEPCRAERIGFPRDLGARSVWGYAHRLALQWFCFDKELIYNEDPFFIAMKLDDDLSNEIQCYENVFRDLVRRWEWKCLWPWLWRGYVDPDETGEPRRLDDDPKGTEAIEWAELSSLVESVAAMRKALDVLDGSKGLYSADTSAPEVQAAPEKMTLENSEGGGHEAPHSAEPAPEPEIDATPAHEAPTPAAPAKHGKKPNRPKDHEFKAARLYREGMIQDAIAKKLGVSQASVFRYIQRVNNWESWHQTAS